MSSASYNFKAIGTTWNIDLPELPSDKSERVIDLVKTRIEIFEQNYSRFRDSSIVGQIRSKAGVYKLPEDAEPMISLYRKLYDITHGKVTPLIGQVLSDAGYDPQYSLKSKLEIPPALKWDDVMSVTGSQLVAKQPISLDFGALGKGYLIDIVAKMLLDNDVTNFTINAGGDIAYRNSDNSPLKVALENPDNEKSAVGEARIVNQSLCGSSGNRRNWGKFHHIIDPELVESPRHIKALWVVADNTLLADGLATALFFMEPEKLAQSFNFQVAILYSDQSGYVSEHFPGNFFEQ